jgi:hypothetical protein
VAVAAPAVPLGDAAADRLEGLGGDAVGRCGGQDLLGGLFRRAMGWHTRLVRGKQEPTAGTGPSTKHPAPKDAPNQPPSHLPVQRLDERALRGVVPAPDE